MSTPSNDSSELSFTPSAAAAPALRRNPLTDAASLINNGGVGHAFQTPTPLTPLEIAQALDIYESQFLPNHPRALSGIALRSFVLGLTTTLSLLLTLVLLYLQRPLWRAPCFILSLSIFHFLEFYTTASANTSDAQISSFLLSSNGSAYRIAHSASFIETLLSHTFLPTLFPNSIHNLLVLLGLSLIILGQLVRAKAMLTAGPNFSHVIRQTKSQTHTLVTTGIYSSFRHPSYFGFFWWGIGTQLLCGNSVCLLGYAVVLWIFFQRRIKGEEHLLVRFFGQEYVDYRARTWVGIPFIE